MNAIKPASRGIRQREVKTVVENRQARHLYILEDTFEAGIMLMGWEVKAICSGQATFNGGAAFVQITDGNAYLHSLTVTPLRQTAHGNFADLTPCRPRKLLLNKSELNKLDRRIRERGYTVVPLCITQGHKLKVQIALAKGKNHADKRDTLKERDTSRDVQRQLKDIRSM